MDRLIDIVLGVRGRYEGRFELAARQIDASSEHLPEIASEKPGVAALGVVVVINGALVEKESQHAANPLDDMRQTGVGGGSIESFSQPGRERLEAPVEISFAKKAQGG